MLPLDLHVLGLPLAFILSQDQTLHCISLNVCPTPGNPRVPASKWFVLNSTLSLQYVYELLVFFTSKITVSVSWKRLALSAKRVQIYAPYFLSAKCFSIFFLKKNQLIYNSLFFRFSFFYSYWILGKEIPDQPKSNHKISVWIVWCGVIIRL